MVAFSPAGRILATCSGDEAGGYDTLKLWDTRTGALRRTLEGLCSRSIAFSCDGRLVATAIGGSHARCWGPCNRWDVPLELPHTRGRTYPITTCIWDIRTGHVKHELAGRGDGLVAATVVDGRQTLVGTWDDDEGNGTSVMVWDMQTGEGSYLPPRPTGSFHCAAGREDGLVALGAYERVDLWDACTRRHLRVLKAPRVRVCSIAFIPGRDILAGGCLDGSVRLWNLRSGRLLRLVEGPDEVATSVTASPDGRTVAGVGGGIVRLWDVDTGKQRPFAADEAGHVCHAAFSPDGRWLVLAAGRSVQWRDAGTGELVRTTGPGCGPVVSLALSPGGESLACGHADGILRLWDVRTGTLRSSRPRGTSPIHCLAYSPDGKQAAAGLRGSGTAWLCNGVTGEDEASLDADRGVVCSLAFSRDGRMLAVGHSGGFIALWDPRTRQLRASFEGGNTASAVTFSGDDQTLVSAENLDSRFWDLGEGRLERILDDPGHRPSSAAYSPDGALLAYGDLSGVTVWDAATVALQKVLRDAGGPSWFGRVLWRDSWTVAWVNVDGDLQLWDAANWEPLLTVRAGAYRARSADLSKDGRLLAVGRGDGSACLMDALTGRVLATLLADNGPNTLSEGLAVTPDGYYEGSPWLAWQVRWRIGSDLFPVASYERLLHRPDMVEAALRGESLPAPPEVLRFQRGEAIPPSVFLDAVPGGAAGHPMGLEILVTGTGAVIDLDVRAGDQRVTTGITAFPSEPVSDPARERWWIPEAHTVMQRFRLQVSRPTTETRIVAMAIAPDGLQGRAEIALADRSASR